MKTKALKKTVMVIIILLAIWGVFFTTDLVRAKRDLHPIFCISFADYSVSSGKVIYTGLFYQVIRTYNIENNSNQYQVTSW